jgi:nucleoid-associated protein YgaU
MGAPKGSDVDKDRKMTRTTYVAEVELGSAPGAKKGAVKNNAMAVETIQEPSSEPITEANENKKTAEEGHVAAVESYTVQNNDTLQGISIKVYGTSKKWKKIFEANSDQLKSPDRIYAGQVLKIPQK